MSNLDQPVPTRAPGETGADFRNRARRDYRFDPGLQDSATDFTAAFTPRLAESLKPTSPLALAAWNQNHPDPISATAPFLGGSLASSVAPSMFSGVSDQGLDPVQNMHEIFHTNGKALYDARTSKTGSSLLGFGQSSIAPQETVSLGNFST